MLNFIAEAENQKAKAFEIIEKTDIIRIWKHAGAKINLIGSLKIGVLAKHRDIDFHIYTPVLDVKQSFAIMAEICAHPQIKKCEFSNLADTEEACFEWHIWFEDDAGEIWQIDMIQIKSGSQYEGYFEKMAKDIISEMTENQRQAIIRLKYETPDDMKIFGIEYYKAVIQNGIYTFAEFLEWRKTQNFSGIISWK